MARRLGASLLVALLVVGVVVLRDANRADSKFTVVSGPPNPVIPIVLHKGANRFEVRATRVAGPGYVQLQVATYLKAPENTMVLAVLGRGGGRVARCVFPPSSYTDNGRLKCRLSDTSRVRGLIVTRRGTAKIAVYGHEHRAGFVVRYEATSLSGRVSTVLSRIAVPLPNGVGSTVLIASLLGSVALTACALLLAVATRRPPGPPTGAPDPTSTDTESRI
jgi:hypothetical protein